MNGKFVSSLNGKIVKTGDKMKIDLNKRSILMIGPGLIDLLNFHTSKKNEIKIEILNCSDPLFLIPLLYRSIKKNIFSKITNQNKTYAVLDKNEIFIHDNLKKEIYFISNIFKDEKITNYKNKFNEVKSELFKLIKKKSSIIFMEFRVLKRIFRQVNGLSMPTKR